MNDNKLNEKNIFPKISLYLFAMLAFVTPWTYWPTSKWFIFPFYDVIFGLLVMGFMISMLLPRPRIPQVTLKDIILILFATWIWFNASTNGSLEYVKPILEMLILAYITSHSKSNETQVNMIIGAALLGGVVVSVIAVYQYLFVKNFLVASTLGNPNLMSGYLSLLLPLSLGFWYHPRLLIRCTGIMCTLILGIGMTLSMTRMGWIVSIFGVIGFALSRDRRLIVVMLIVLLIFGSVAGARERFAQIKIITGITSIFSKDYDNGVPITNSLESRISLWKFAVDQTKTTPLVGIGPGNFRDHLSDYLSENPSKRRLFNGVEDSHNSYIKFMVETGLPGLALLLVLLCLWIGPFARGVFQAEHKTRTVEKAAFWGIIAYLLHNMTNNLLLTVPTSLAFWLVLGLVWNMKWTEGLGEKSEPV